MMNRSLACSSRQWSGSDAALLPALNLVAAPGQRRANLDIAREIERARLCRDLRLETNTATWRSAWAWRSPLSAILSPPRSAPIYAQTAEEFAHSAAYNPRGVRRPLSIRHRRRARPEPPAYGGETRQAARRHPCLCRQVQILRGPSVHCPRSFLAALRKRMVAPARARLRRSGVRQWQPLAYGRVTGRASSRPSAAIRISLSATGYGPVSATTRSRPRRCSGVR